MPIGAGKIESQQIGMLCGDSVETEHLPMSRWGADLRTGDDLLLAAMSADFLRDVLAFLSRSTMNFLVLGCPAGDSSLPRFTQLPAGDCLWLGDLLTSGDLLTCGDLLVTFGDLFMAFGDLFFIFGDPVNSNLTFTSGDLWTTSNVLPGATSLQCDVPFTAWCGLRSGKRWVAVVMACVTSSDINDSDDLEPSDVSRSAFSDAELFVYFSLLAADGEVPAGNCRGLCGPSDCLADNKERRLALLVGDGLWSVNFSLRWLAAESVRVFSGVADCHKHPTRWQL